MSINSFNILKLKRTTGRGKFVLTVHRIYKIAFFPQNTQDQILLIKRVRYKLMNLKKNPVFLCIYLKETNPPPPPPPPNLYKFKDFKKICLHYKV